MRWNLPRLQFPLLSPAGGEAVERAGSNVVPGIGNVNIFVYGVYHNAVGLFNPFVGSVCNDVAGDNFVCPRIYNAVGDFPVVGNVAELRSVDVE